MFKNIKNKFQDIHYSRQKPSFCLRVLLYIGEFIYKNIIETKNYLYKKNIFKEYKTQANVICVGNLTTGGVGKTPIVTFLANEIAKKEKVAIISRGYKAKLSNKEPNIIKDFDNIYFQNGELCGDEPFQLSKKVTKNVAIITCANRKKAIELVINKYNCKNIILDDGFSNRKVKKDKSIIVIDSAMRFGNGHLLPYGPLREPIKEIKRADEIILVNKQDGNIQDAIDWTKKSFNKNAKICEMIPNKVYNLITHAEVIIKNKQKAIAFCAIGQPNQFFNFAKKYYNIEKNIAFDDHHTYTKADIKKLIKIAQKNNINTFITTQKDEAKLKNIVKDINKYSFNVVELELKMETL